MKVCHAQYYGIAGFLCIMTNKQLLLAQFTQFIDPKTPGLETLYRIAGKVGGEFTLANWQFLCPLPKYNPPTISLKKPNILHCIRNHRISMKKQGVTC